MSEGNNGILKKKQCQPTADRTVYLFDKQHSYTANAS